MISKFLYNLKSYFVNYKFSVFSTFWEFLISKKEKINQPEATHLPFNEYLTAQMLSS